MRAIASQDLAVEKSAAPRGTLAALVAGLVLTAAWNLAVPCSAVAGKRDQPITHEIAAKDTVAVAQMNHGDTLRFRLKSGEERTFVLQQTSARIVERVRGGIVYSFECELLADGQPLTLRRFVCSQEAFYEPWVVNGVRIWFSSSAAIFKLVPIRYPDQHDPMDSDAVLVLQDATLPICPQPMRPWFPIEQHFIDVGKCYNGDDPWLGPYLGQACHVGLDINMPKGTPLYAPLDFDDHWIFSADHRWRGVRRWPNGDIWALQSHHVNRMLVPERGKLKVGTHYGEAAGKGIGSHQHSHFEFRLGEGVLNRGQLGGIEVDPWILFWQIFENDRAEKGLIRAQIDPLAPTTTGQTVRFSASRSRGGPKGSDLRYYWAFGDGGWSVDPEPEYTFVKPGVYPVTLVIDDGQDKATHTQHITVNGEAIKAPSLVLTARSEELSFDPRPVFAADVYGLPVKQVPHTLRFTAAPSQSADNAPPTRTLNLHNRGDGPLPTASQPRIQYLGEQTDWLIVRRRGRDRFQTLHTTVDASKAGTGTHQAVVEIECPGVINGRQAYRVELFVRPSPTDDVVIVDDRDEGFSATPFVWVGHQFLRCPDRGYKKRYLTDGGQSDNRARVVFRPDLAAGRYEVWLHEQSPIGDSVYAADVHSQGSLLEIPIYSPKSQTLKLGTFDFVEGNAGTVEFRAKSGDARTPVIVDAVEFRRVSKE